MLFGLYGCKADDNGDGTAAAPNASATAGNVASPADPAGQTSASHPSGAGTGAGAGAGAATTEPVTEAQPEIITLLTWADPAISNALDKFAAFFNAQYSAAQYGATQYGAAQNNVDQHNAAQDNATRHSAAQSGVVLDIIKINASSYDQARQTRLMANDADIVSYDGGFLHPQEPWNQALMDKPHWQQAIESGLLKDITDEPFVSRYDIDSLLDAYGYDGRVYGLMAGAAPSNGVFYNADRFEELGLAIPETWDEFAALCEAIKAAGYQPLMAGGGDTWPVNIYAGLISTNALLDDAQPVYESLFTGEKKFTDPDILTLYGMCEQFCSYLEPGAADMPYALCYGRFAAERALMLADGLMSAADVAAAGPVFKFSYFPLPGINKRGDGLIQQMGLNYGYAMAAAASSPRVGIAMDVLDFFSQKEIYKEFIAGTRYFPTQPDYAESNELYMSMGAYMQKPRANAFAYAPKGVGEYGGNGGFNLFLLNALGGPFTAAELAEEAQKDWDAARFMAESDVLIRTTGASV